MKINELIKAVTKDYMPIKKTVVEAQKSGRELTEKEMQTYFELNTTIEFYKILKGVFMEEVTKNKKMTDSLVASGVLTTHTETAEKDGKSVTIEVVDQSMDDRIDLVPNDIQQAILEKMVKAHKENIDAYSKRGDNEALKKEEYELSIINGFLPKEATQEDIMEYLNEYYPSGVEQKFMGKVIGEVKKAFARANGQLVAQCVKSKIV